MRYKILEMGMLAGVLAVFAVGAVAQREEHHPDSQATQPQAQTPTEPQPGMMGGGMTGGMMSMMGQMTNQNQQMSDMVAKMTQNMAAMQNEKDPTKIKTMMADQQAMLEQMRGQMMKQGNMMQNSSGMMMKNCPMAGDDSKPSAK
jgi:hypothetical protein